VASPPLALRDADVRYLAQWIDPVDARAIFDAVRSEIAWETHRIRLFGREIDAPRQSCWIGDPGTDYTYSRTRFAPRSWTPTLTALRRRLREELGVDFNSVLANRYRDGRDSMGWHSDDEPELGTQPVIASLSFGAVRRFDLRHRNDATQRHAIDLESGSLLLMQGETQRHWQHALPRTAKPCGERINLTFRVIDTTAASGTRRRA
jgi:alkylated DNA repair dioxygenase AlkB